MSGMLIILCAFMHIFLPRMFSAEDDDIFSSSITYRHRLLYRCPDNNYILGCYLCCPNVRQAMDPKKIHSCTTISSVSESRKVGSNLSFTRLSCQF